MIKFFLLAFLFLLSACTPVFDARETSAETQVETVRHMALVYGAQSGLAWQSKRINHVMESYSKQLDAIYNFKVLMMKNNMLPPVVQEAKNIMNADSMDVMRLADREIQIVRLAQLVTVAPTWRDYLIMSYTKPELPDKNLVLNTKKERESWVLGYTKGWKQGVKQADAIFSQALGMINRDFNGMVLYHTLLAQNMISSAHTATAHLGVTGDEKIMRVNDQILRITENAKLRPNQVEDWHAVIDLLEN